LRGKEEIGQPVKWSPFTPREWNCTWHSMHCKSNGKRPAPTAPHCPPFQKHGVKLHAAARLIRSATERVRGRGPRRTGQTQARQSTQTVRVLGSRSITSLRDIDLGVRPECRLPGSVVLQWFCMQARYSTAPHPTYVRSERAGRTWTSGHNGRTNPYLSLPPAFRVGSH
jgi:hypothetical protein